MDRGWVKLWVKSIDSQVFTNSDLWKVWSWCLMKARRKPGYVEIKTGRGYSEVKLERGQFVFGRHKAAVKLRMKPSSLWKRMQKLKNLENVDIESNTHFSIITIRNWELYQAVQIEKEQGKEQPSDNQVTTKEQPSDTLERDKRVIEGGEGREKVKNTVKYPEDFMAFWTDYPRKVKKQDALKAWRKKNGRPSIEVILKRLTEHKKDPEWLKEKGKYIPHPTTYINGARWEDEIQPIHPLEGKVSPKTLKNIEILKNWEPKNG